MTLYVSLAEVLQTMVKIVAARAVPWLAEPLPAPASATKNTAFVFRHRFLRIQSQSTCDILFDIFLLVYVPVWEGLLTSYSAASASTNQVLLAAMVQVSTVFKL